MVHATVMLYNSAKEEVKLEEKPMKSARSKWIKSGVMLIKIAIIL